MKISKNLNSLAILLWLLFPSVSFAFDCNKVSNRIELLICTTPDILKLDGEMLALQQEIIANKMPIIPSQSEWRRQRNGCREVGCLRAFYYSRIVFFKTQLTSMATPLENSNSSHLMPPDISSSDEASQTTPPYIGPAETMSAAPVQAQRTVREPQSWKDSDLKSETISATLPAKQPLVTGKELRGFIMWIVFLAALLGIYKISCLPATQSFLKSYFANLRVEFDKSKLVARRVYSPLYFWLITLPLLVITAWLTYNVSLFFTAVFDISFFSSECSPPSISSFDYAGWQNASVNYYAQHPECAPGNQENNGLDIFEQRGFLIAYDILALLAVLYIDINLLLRKTLFTRQNILPFCLAWSVVFSRIVLGFFWPYLGFLSPAVPTILTGLLWAIPIPLIVMVILVPISIMGAIGLIFSVISIILLPIVALFNQMNIFMLARQRQELQAAGIYGWLTQFKQWLTTTSKSSLSADASIGTSFSAQENSDTINAPSLNTLKTDASSQS